MNSIHKFRGDCDIRVWLCQIAKNCYLSYLKKRGQTKNDDDLELQYFADPNETPEEKLVKQEEIAQVRKQLHEIPEP